MDTIERRLGVVEIAQTETAKALSETQDWIRKLETDSADLRAGLSEMRTELRSTDPRWIAAIAFFFVVVWSYL